MHKYADLTLQLLIDISRPYYTDSKWQHIQDVLRYAKLIKQQPLSDLLKAVIYMHDTLKKRIGNTGHLAASAELTKKLFKDKYTKDKLRRIYLAIKLHSPDYRSSKKNFHHSSPLALLLALADDSNNLERDPDLMAMVSVKFLKSMPDVYDTPLKGLDRHKQFFGPLHGHSGLKYYKDRWNLYAKLGIKNIDNYPQGKYNLLWSLVNKDTQLPDIDSLNKSAALDEDQLISLSRPYYTDLKWQHINDVLNYAKDIKQKPLSNLEKAIIYLHDSLKRRVGQVGHEEASAQLAGKLLNGQYTKQELRRIVNAIKLHDPEYRLSRKNFHHSSPLALLLALADDSNNLKRDPDLMAMKTIWYSKIKPAEVPDVNASYDRFMMFAGPLHGHPGLKYYKDRWNLYAKEGIKNIDNYPRGKYNLLWSLVNKDTLLPDTDSLNKE